MVILRLPSLVCDAAWSLVIFGVDPEPANAPPLKQWAQDYWTAIHPFNLAPTRNS